MNRSIAADVDMLRRRLLIGAAALAGLAAAPPFAEALPGALDAAALGVKPGETDQTRGLQRALDRAAKEGRPLALAPGLYRAAGLALADGAVVVGVPELTRLELVGTGPLLVVRGARRASVRGLVLDGANMPAGQEVGVLQADGAQDLTLDEVAVTGAGGGGIVLSGAGGAVRRCRVEGARHAGLFSMDGRGLSVTDCVVRNCRNNGIVIRRSQKGEDGSVVSRCRIEDIGALDGGLGWNGNGVNVSRAAGVMVTANAIRRSAFSALRAHEADDAILSDNLCLLSGETGIYAEYGFSGAVISGNLVDGAANGISVVNFNEGGRLATVTGNVVRNAFRRPLLDEPGEGYGCGVSVEADTAVTGNVVEACPDIGILAGWGPYLRDVAVSGNVIRSCGVGIGVSVVEGVGATTITGNTISDSRRGAVLGYLWREVATADLATGGGASRPGLLVSQNASK